MLRNYFLIAFRQYVKNPGTTFINISGLIFGITACLLIFLWVQDELSFDTHHKNAENIYRVSRRMHYNNTNNYSSHSVAPLGPALKKDFPWVEEFVRITKRKTLLELNKTYIRGDVVSADKSIFKIFDIPLILGNPETALEHPNFILISEGYSKQFFAGRNPVGQELVLENRDQYIISGVFKDIPRTAHFHFDVLHSVEKEAAHYSTKWGSFNFRTYVKVNPEASLDQFEEASVAFIDRVRGEEYRKKFKMRYLLTPLLDLHSRSEMKGELEPGVPILLVYVFSFIGLVVLMLAALNYINLSTSQYLTRAREVGLRRVLGANKLHIFPQFLCESLGVTAVSVILSLTLTGLLLPMLNSITGKDIAFNLFENLPLMLFSLAVFITVGSVSGIVPAMFIAAFKPASVLMGNFRCNPATIWLRRIQVVFQFSLSMILIICTIIVYNQVEYMKTRDLGFKPHQIIIIPNIGNKEILSQMDSMKQEMKRHVSISNVTATSFFPDVPGYHNNYWTRTMDPSERLSMDNIAVDPDTFHTLGMELVQGQWFSEALVSQHKEGFVLNETAVKRLGLKEPVGEYFNIGNWKKGKIIGVVKDFNYESLHSKVSPMTMFMDSNSYNYLMVKVSAQNLPAALRHLEATWQKFVRGYSFTYSFLDREFQKLYFQESQVQKLLTIFLIITIIIAGLGLYGQASFIAQQRTKEIGIRKTLGATTGSIFMLIATGFLKMVLLGIIIATPFAIDTMQYWLKDFAYRINISVWPFVLTFLFAALIAMISIFSTTYRAAKVSPIKSLKYE